MKKLVKEFLNEITREEDEWANAQIDKWRAGQEASVDDLEEYTNNIVDHLWDRLLTKLSVESLEMTNTTKETLKQYITEVDSPYGLYMSVSDYWEENTPWEEAADTMFDEVYRAITEQGWSM